MERSGRPLIVLGAALLSGSSFAAPASPQGRPSPPAPVPIIQVASNLIRVDASVTDSTGRPIGGLNAADFTVEIDGQRQPVRNAMFFGGESGPAATGKPMAVPDRSLIFVVDDLNASYASLFLVKDTLRSFVGRWNPAVEQVAIRLTSDKQGTVTLSRSPERFVEAIDGIHFNTLSSKEASSGPAVRKLVLPFGVDLDLSPKVEHVVEVGGEDLRIDLSPIEIPTVNPVDNFRQRLYCLLSTIQGMKSLPGRKGLILVGERLLSREGQPMAELGVSTPFDSFIDGQATDSALRAIAELANRASVVIYTIDARGLASDAASAEVPPSPTASPRSVAEDPRRRGSSSLQQLAEETGGIAISNRNGLKSGLDQIVMDQRSFYVIGFAPPKGAFAKTSGKAKFHDLRLKVDRPDAVVRTRSGFYGVTDQDIGSRHD